MHNHRHSPTRRTGAAGASGFTLIELMIAVVVVAILAAVALPSFMDSVRKSRRTEAFALLSAVQLAQERWRANNAAYASSVSNAATGTPPGLNLPSRTPSSYYDVTLSNLSGTGYTVLATAVAGSSQANDGDCARLQIRVEEGNLLYGSSSLTGAMTESAGGNKCWSR